MFATASGGFVGGDMGKHQTTGRIADGEDVPDACAELLVDRDAASRGLDANGIEPQIGQGWRPTSRNQDAVAFDNLPIGRVDGDAGWQLLYPLNAGANAHVDALFPHVRGQEIGKLGILSLCDVLAALEHGDTGTEPAVCLCKLGAQPRRPRYRSDVLAGSLH